MSLIDTRYPDLDLFLQRWQRRLNTRVSVGEGLAAWMVTVPVASSLAFVTNPSPSARIAVVAGFSALASAAFVLWRRKRRLTRNGAASWLDEQSRSLGLFRAASECLDREVAGPGGDRVLAQADRLRSAVAVPRLPWHRLAQRAALALVVTAGAGLVLALAPPVPTLLGHRADSTSPPTLSLSPKQPAADSRQLSPHEAAQRLFPEDARLAALAEQALASGDPGALEALLEQNTAGADRAGAPGGSASGGEPGRAPGQPGADDGTAHQAEGSGKGDPGTSGPSRTRGGNQPSESASKAQQEKGGKPGPSGKSPGGDQSSRTSGPQGQVPGGSSPGQTSGSEQTPFQSGGAPGTGQSQQPLGSRPAAGTSDRSLVLKEQENPGVFEYVLPGTGPQLPSSQTVADARRSAEAIISRSAPPLEFENTIRDYFLSLTSLTKAQEASP